MEPMLRVGVLAALAWAVGLLAAQLWQAQAHGRRRFLAWPAGSRTRAIAYALGPGMLPGAKESAREHLPVWFVGIGYHAGIFASLLVVAASVTGVAVAAPVLLPLRALTLLGAICGVLLLARRALSRSLRALSVPDDLFANVLTTGTALWAFAVTLRPQWERWLLLSALLLLVYVPVGKIRHCVFFFATRLHAAAFFGRRGVLPPAG